MLFPRRRGIECHRLAARGGGAWLSLVERQLWELNVVGSNPTAPSPRAAIFAMEQHAREVPVAFRSSGEQIIGMWHVPAGEGPFPAVVFFHGFTGHKVEAHRIFVQQARALAGAGIAALRFDFRGSGDSAGEFSDMTVSREVEDAHCAISWVRNRQEVDPTRIGILGFSLGGMVAAFALAKHPDVRAAVLWNPVSDPIAARDRRRTPTSDAELQEYGAVNSNGYAVGARFLAELEHLKPLEAIALTQVPVLIVCASNDEAVLPAESRRYVDTIRASGGTCEFHEIAGADHTFSSFPAKTECLAVTLNWFRDRL